MAAPTSVSITVDKDEYSRYEDSNNTITATVTIQGGAAYVDEPIVVELLKARRSRDTVVASTTVLFSGPADPQQDVVEFVLPDLVDQDYISLVRNGKYFVRAVHEMTSATATIGSGANGEVTLSSEGADGNLFTVEVVVPVGTSPLSVAVAGTDIVVYLAVSGGVPVPAQNTSFLVSAAINGIFTNDEVTSTYSGTGEDSLSIAEGPTTFVGGTDEIVSDSEDFHISVISIDRFKKEFLFGIDVSATSLMEPKFQPKLITGVTIIETSDMLKAGFHTLSYTYNEDHTANATATVGSGVDGTITVVAVGAYEGSDGNALTVSVLVPAGTSGLSVALVGTDLQVSLAVNAGVPDNAANTATLVAAAIAALPDFTATASGTGATPLTAISGPTAFSGGLTTILRFLSWDGGPLVSIPSGGTYLLKGGSGKNCPASVVSAYATNSYVIVRVSSTSALPTVSITEEILIDRKRMDDESLRHILCESLSWIENDFLMTFIEPTVVTSDLDPTTIQYTAGIQSPAPIIIDSDFDVVNGPLTYYPSQGSDWINIQTPYLHLLRVDSLFGSIANTRVIDIDLEWIHHYDKGGLIQLVPFNQEIAFDFVGLIWSNAIRGAVAIPNFWHFNVIAGMRGAPCDIQDLLGRYAAMKALTLAGQAFRPGLGSLSLSRDGVSESVSYNTQATYGIYTSAIQAHKDWLADNKDMIRAKHRGMLTRFL